MPVAIISLVFMAFMSIVVMFPTSPDPTADTMNYTVVVLGGVLILALAYFYFPVYGGVYWFEGPVRNISADVVKKMEKLEAVVGSDKESQYGNGQHIYTSL